MEQNLKQGRDYRADLARHYIPLYEVAAQIKVHPCRLGRMLRERERITNPVRIRLDAFLHQLEVKENLNGN